MMETIIQGLAPHDCFIDPPPRGKDWYAVYTVVRHEKTVNSSLLEKSIDTFLPLREVASRWKDRRKSVRFPLFPGYLFVNIHPQERYTVLNTRGVVKILGAGGNPIPVPVEQVDAVKRILESRLEYEPYYYFVPGKEALVVKGPFQGLRGRILERRSGYRLILSVDIIQRAVAVEVDVRDLELV